MHVPVDGKSGRASGEMRHVPADRFRQPSVCHLTPLTDVLSSAMQFTQRRSIDDFAFSALLFTKVRPRRLKHGFALDSYSSETCRW